MKLLWKLRFILKEYWLRYLTAFIFLQIVSALNLASPWLVGKVVDGIQANSLTLEQVGLYAGGIALVGIVVYAFRFIWRSQLYGAAVLLTQKQRSRLFAHFTSLSPTFYQHYTSGDLMAHATNDLNAVEESAGSGIMTLVDSLIAGFTVLFAMIFLVSGKLTFIAMIPLPILVWITKQYGSALHARFGKSQATFSNLNEETRESIAGIRAVKAHQLSERQSGRFAQLSEATVEANQEVALVDAMFGPTIALFFGMSTILGLLGGAWMISEDEITIGQLTAFTLYLGQILGPMMQFGWQFNVFQRGSASWTRLEKLFSHTSEVKDAPDAQPAGDDTTLQLQLCAFGYEQEHIILRDIDLTIPQGSFVGITGRTGSGKSTLFRLIMREFDLPQGSQITLGGVPLQKLQLQSLRKKLAWVPQEPMLFSGSIASNIRFANPEATMEQVENAAKLAAIHDEIVRFQDGYETLLGENGINLSGGQKQRVALARALLSDAPILLLDDAFSALDMKTEATILKNLFAMKTHKTLILITQRLPELLSAEHILVLDHGQVLEQGTHKTLMAAEHGTGWYARIFRQQARVINQPLGTVEDLS